MSRGHLVRHTLRLGVLGAAATCWPALATGEPDRALDRRACSSAYKSAVELQQSAHFRQAQELALTCMNEACGPGIRQKCSALAMDMEADVPSVVPIVVDTAGTPRIDVRVMVDGELLTSQLNGMSLPIDPGVHEFSFSADNRVFATKKIMIAQGQRNRAIAVSIQPSDKRAKTMAPVPAAPLEPKSPSDKSTSAKAELKLDSDKWSNNPASTEAPVNAAAPPAATSPEQGIAWKPLVPYGFAGVGLLGIGAFALASSEGEDTAANVSLGVGVAGLAAAFTSWFWLRGSDAPKEGAHAAVVDVHPTRGGGVATVSGSF